MVKFTTSICKYREYSLNIKHTSHNFRELTPKIKITRALALMLRITNPHLNYAGLQIRRDDGFYSYLPH